MEDLLRTSTKNVAQEVVSSLIPPQGGLGVLADVQQSDITHRKGGSAATDQLLMANSPGSAAATNQQPSSANT